MGINVLAAAAATLVGTAVLTAQPTSHQMPGQMPPPAALAPGQVPPPPPGPLPAGIAPNTLGRPGVMAAPNMMLPQMPICSLAQSRR